MFSWFLFPIVHCESTETLLMFMLALYSTAWLNLFTRTKSISLLKLFRIFWKYHVIWKQRTLNLFLSNLDPFSSWIVVFGTPNTTLSRKYKLGTLVPDLRRKVFCFCGHSQAHCFFPQWDPSTCHHFQNIVCSLALTFQGSHLVMSALWYYTHLLYCFNS